MEAQQAPDRDGRLIFLRRTDERGRAHLLGHAFDVDEHWAHRLDRSEVDFDQAIRFYGLRRRDPTDQRPLNERAYRLPDQSFRH